MKQDDKRPPFFTGTLFLALTLLAGCSEAEAPMALGTLERDRINLRATAAEVIREQPRPEGATLQAGELLVQLNDTQQRLRIAALEAEAEAARQRLQLLENGFRVEDVAAAEARSRAAAAMLDEQQRNVERLRTVAERDLAARAELETAEARRDQQQALLDEAREQLRLLRSGNRAEEIAAARASLDTILANISREQEVLQDLSLTAPAPGLLEQLPWEVGERVQPGTVVAVLLTGEAPYARVYIPETHRLKVEVGTRLTVHVDGLESPLQGEVRWIASEAAFTPYYALNREERSRLVYLTEIALPATAANLPVGLPVQAELPE